MTKTKTCPRTDGRVYVFDVSRLRASNAAAKSSIRSTRPRRRSSTDPGKCLYMNYEIDNKPLQ